MGDEVGGLRFEDGRWFVIVDHELSAGDLLAISHDVADALSEVYPNASEEEVTPRFRQRRREDGRYELEIL